MSTATTRSHGGGSSVARHRCAPQSDGAGNIGFEREFLIRLAALWFGYRWLLMGNELTGWTYPVKKRSNAVQRCFEMRMQLLGHSQNADEMRLLCAEVQSHED